MWSLVHYVAVGNRWMVPNALKVRVLSTGHFSEKGGWDVHVSHRSGPKTRSKQRDNTHTQSCRRRDLEKTIRPPESTKKDVNKENSAETESKYLRKKYMRAQSKVFTCCDQDVCRGQLWDDRHHGDSCPSRGPFVSYRPYSRRQIHPGSCRHYLRRHPSLP